MSKCDGVERFYESIEEWKDKSHLWVLEPRAIFFEIGYKLGANFVTSDDFIGNTKERVLELLNNEKINEDFLVCGMVNVVTETLERIIYTQGSSIVNNEESIRRSSEVQQKYNFDEESREEAVDAFERVLTRLKRTDYYQHAQINLDNWKEIVSRNFSRSKRNEWEDQQAIEAFGKYKI
ncbi:hypothetical protein [Paenibacillus residui]|uniref:Uncharacterized protein n=1 Tax=Paenibacillus residui TaxID=629724 RepID=A0ABW3D658_9BACL